MKKGNFLNQSTHNCTLIWDPNLEKKKRAEEGTSEHRLCAYGCVCAREKKIFLTKDTGWEY